MKDKYGTDTLNIIINHFWGNRTALFNKEFDFGYPYYGGLPKKATDRLTSLAVDLIQDNWHMIMECKTKKQLEKLLCGMFFLLGDEASSW